MFFKRIGDLRVDNDLTQKKMASILNVPRSTYSKWELGICNIPLDKFDVFLNYFNVSADYVLSLSNEKGNCGNTFDKNILRKRLINVRKTYKTSQQQLSDKLNFYQTTYSGYETGHSVIPLDKLYTFASEFSISVDYLMGKSENIKITNKQYINN